LDWDFKEWWADRV